MRKPRHMPYVNRAALVAEYLDIDGRAVRRGALVARFGRRSVETAVLRGLVVEVLPGILVHASRDRAFTTLMKAASMWLPRSAVISGAAALVQHGLAQDAPRLITVIVPRKVTLRSPPWMRVVHTDTVNHVVLKHGVRYTSRERAIVDAWSEVGRPDRVSTVLEALRRCNLTGVAVSRELARMPRVAGRRELTRLLSEASAGIQSYLEHRAHRTILNTKDFRDLKRQVPFTALGDRYVVDTYDEGSRTVIEFDGAKVHGTREAKARDNARDAALASLGVLTLRFSYHDVMTRPLWCREVIRRTIAARSGRA